MWRLLYDEKLNLRPRTVRVGLVTSTGSVVAASHVSATAAQTARAVGQSCDTCMTCSSCRSPVSCAGTRGAVALVALTLMVTLPVAMVYVDIQVMALILGDGGVHDRLGDPG